MTQALQRVALHFQLRDRAALRLDLCRALSSARLCSVVAPVVELRNLSLGLTSLFASDFRHAVETTNVATIRDTDPKIRVNAVGRVDEWLKVRVSFYGSIRSRDCDLRALLLIVSDSDS